MVYLKITITKDLYDDLKPKGEQAIKDYGFDYLYEKKYIKSEKEYKGCFLHRTGEQYEVVFRTLNNQ